jgi:ActR/RegA family two-component response regulator
VCKILIVEDTPDVRITLKGALVDEGYTVRAVSNEGQAMDAVLEESYDFACVDVKLHGNDEEDESGSSLALALSALDPRIRVILLTRYPRTKQIVRAVQYLGVIGFVNKRTQDWVADTVQILAKAREARETQIGEEAAIHDGRDSHFESRMDTREEATSLSLFLAPSRPLKVRARGGHVCSSYSSGILDMDLDSYVRQTELAQADPVNRHLQMRNIGRDLWRDIFTEHPKMERAFVEARAKSRTLSLHFESSRDLLRLPLEFMRSDEPDEYLILEHPFSRFLSGAAPNLETISPRMLVRTRELHVLIIASNTEPPIPEVDAEAQRIYRYFKSQKRFPIRPTLVTTDEATYERVRKEMRSGEYDIIHYAGHGFHRDDSPEKSGLFFWADENRNRAGGLRYMRASELKFLLGRSKTRLIYLSSCYGTAAAGATALLDNDFLGLADAAAQAGVPTVLGFRWPVSDNGACDMALAFYRSLLEQGNPEVALWHARCELAVDREDTTWMSPILIHQN